MKYAESITDLIGGTPVVKLQRVAPEGGAELFAKLESFNPGGSVKDRIGLAMIEAAEKDGQLKPGGTIVEPTSGNTGIGLAMVAAARGYNLILAMPESMSLERRKILSTFGAKIVLTPAAKGMKGAVAGAETIMEKTPGAFMPQQFDNPANPEVHARTTAREIIDVFGTSLDAFVAGVGTGGTITGVGRVLKKEISEILTVTVEPEESPVLSGGEPGPHKIQGIGGGWVPTIYDPGVVDRILTVNYGEACCFARRLATEEGILAGISCGAAAHVAAELAREMGPGKKVLVLLPDTGERYLSTELFAEPEPLEGMLD
jgi:cysteine synthase A